jgi:hypothetical protein
VENSAVMKIIIMQFYQPKMWRIVVMKIIIMQFYQPKMWSSHENNHHAVLSTKNVENSAVMKIIIKQFYPDFCDIETFWRFRKIAKSDSYFCQVRPYVCLSPSVSTHAKPQHLLDQF